jgi:lipoyl(octanoyl) transferase
MSFQYVDLGLRDYAECYQLQKELRVQRQTKDIRDQVLFVEHPPVYTLGKRSTADDFVHTHHQFPVIQTDRGGRVTYHGPGQMVVYFIFDLTSRRLSIPQWTSQIQEILKETLAHWDAPVILKSDQPGLWTQDGLRKIGSLGFHVDRGVTMHGVSLNVSCRLQDYEAIHPCGLQADQMTTLEQEIGLKVPLTQVKEIFKKAMDRNFPNPLKGRIPQLPHQDGSPTYR